MISDYPAHPGAKVDGTSRAAAIEMDEHAPTLRELVLDLFRSHRDITTDEAAKLLGKTVLAIRPRFSELREMGRIEPTGARRTNASGMTANVWRLCAPRTQGELFA